MSTAQPLNVATPDTAERGLVVQDSVAPPAVVNARVTALVAVVTVLPPASWTATAGWVANAMPPVPDEGDVVNASFVAGPMLTMPLGPLAAVHVRYLAVTVYR